MSKIEKALNRARLERGNNLVPFPGSQRNEMTQNTGGGRNSSVVTVDTEAALSSATINKMREMSIRAMDDMAEKGIISAGRGADDVVQAFRELRTKIFQRCEGRNGVIMVTSVSKGGGSSFVSTNLSAAFAFDASKTALLIDCNIRNPALNYLLPQTGIHPGLTDYLESDSMDIANIIYSVGIERLRFIPAGKYRDVPVEHFSSQKIQMTIESLRRRYRERFIILDAPPMSEVADSHTLAELSDYALLIVRHGQDTRAQISDCVNAIGPKLLGFIFNDEPQPPSSSLRELFLNPFLQIFSRT